jgi:hypothetical protein
MEKEMEPNSLEFQLWLHHFFKENDEIRYASRFLRHLRPYFDPNYIDPHEQDRKPVKRPDLRRKFYSSRSKLMEARQEQDIAKDEGESSREGGL